MLKSLRTQQSLLVLATLAVCLFMISQVLWAMGPARLLPSGKVTVYRGDQVISVLSEEAPLPEGALLVSEGQSGLRMDNLFLVAEDGSQFSVATGGEGRELLIRQGTLYFAMTEASGPMTFHAPDGSVTTERMTLNASAEGGLLKGYVDATPEGTRIGVLEGGSLVILTAEGERTIAAGRQITLAQADLFDDDLAAGAGAADPRGLRLLATAQAGLGRGAREDARHLHTGGCEPGACGAARSRLGELPNHRLKLRVRADCSL